MSDRQHPLSDVRIGRRRLLKALMAAGGAAAASALPSGWSAPLVEVGALPAHAQISPVLGTGDLQITMTWNNGTTDCGDEGSVDVDLHVVEPDGTRVYWIDTSGPTAELDYDNVCGFGPENIFVAADQAAAGTYQVQVDYYGAYGSFAGEPTTATFRITLFDGTPQQQVHTFVRTLPAPGPLYPVADITFPAGTVVDRTGDPAAAPPASLERTSK